MISPKELVIPKLVDYLDKTLHPAKTYFVYKNNNVLDAKTNQTYFFGRNAYFMLDKMVGDKEILPSSNPQDIKNKFPDTIEYMDKNKVHAFVTVRVPNYGFIMLYENAVTRMWQDYDLVLLTVAAAFLGYNLDK